MKRIPLNLAEVRRETPLHLHVRLENAPADWCEAYAGPGMKVRLELGDGAEGKAGDEVGLASVPRRGPVEVLLDQDSALGRALAGAAPGATVQASPPLGYPIRLFEHRGMQLYLAGRGEGLGPVRAAVLEAITDRGAFDSIRVVAEASYTDEIPYRDEMPAWQRAGVEVTQALSRPDVGKWKRGEAAYVYELFQDLRPQPDRSVVFVAGPDDMVQGMIAACRELEIPPDRLLVFELDALRRQHRPEAERPRELTDKITAEGIWGSGHQDDAPDHGPVYATPRAAPRPIGLPAYKAKGRA